MLSEYYSYVWQLNTSILKQGNIDSSAPLLPLPETDQSIRVGVEGDDDDGVGNREYGLDETVKKLE